MGIYRKKPVEVEAFQWTGDKDQEPEPVWFSEAMRKGTVIVHRTGDRPQLCVHHVYNENMSAKTYAELGDYIVREGDAIHPVSKITFEKHFEKAEDLSSMLSEFGEADCESCKI